MNNKYKYIEQELSSKGIRFNPLTLLGVGQIGIEIPVVGIVGEKTKDLIEDILTNEKLTSDTLQITLFKNEECIKIQFKEHRDIELENSLNPMFSLGVINF